MMLYEELLLSCRDRLAQFLKNVPVFENQFTWSPCSEQCYRLMYLENDRACPASVKALKAAVPELTALCKKCGQFFIPARNKSVPKYDLLLGAQHEEALMSFLQEKLGASVVRADLANRSYPDCKILKPDGTAAAYFEIKFHGAPFVLARQKTGRFCYEGSATLDYRKVQKQLALIETELDAPAFYVHWIEYPCLKGVFFETSEQVRAYIDQTQVEFERRRREGDGQKSPSAVYTQKIYPPLLAMGSFEEFLETLRALLSR